MAVVAIAVFNDDDDEDDDDVIVGVGKEGELSSV